MSCCSAERPPIMGPSLGNATVEDHVHVLSIDVDRCASKSDPGAISCGLVQPATMPPAQRSHGHPRAARYCRRSIGGRRLEQFAVCADRQTLPKELSDARARTAEQLSKLRLGCDART